ncbi:hypothetical protein QRX60_27970 [Amycolatopsis mongoliensis]|uniref:Uncharacterized protein n=1 Tax=Amycolatopsis mongoliensis TaxID=715475 RepID=A0A9Y2NFR7_9PSEU|nr:hypothetical protein [Amycolatopsis sp. 4-36]WIX97917.1 hypothetical protein QRX60_27970 [Amycolatopsis sp. 4-36]
MIPRLSKDRVVVVLAAVVVLGLLAFIGRGKVSLDTTTLLGGGCTLPARITAVPGSAGAAPDGGGVRIAEQAAGVAVLENTSAQVAHRIAVTSGPRTVEVPLLTPGERIGVVLDRPVLGPVTWLTPESLGGFTPVTATVVPGGVRYHSANCRALTSRGAAVVHRDATGRITGGEQLPAASVSCAVGEKELPAALVPGTEVYPYCALGPE